MTHSPFGHTTALGSAQVILDPHDWTSGAHPPKPPLPPGHTKLDDPMQWLTDRASGLPTMSEGQSAKAAAHVAGRFGQG